MLERLGRTNEFFPPIWLSLSTPTHERDLEELARTAIGSGVPLDVSSQPALWGHYLKGAANPLVTIGGVDIENANDEAHATVLVEAHLIETLSALGRVNIDFYFLRVRRGLEEHQITGALAALDAAKQEGHIRFIGLCCDGHPVAVRSVWQFHDAFDTVLIPRNHYNSNASEDLMHLAVRRRAGVVTYRPLNWGYGVPFFSLQTSPCSDEYLVQAVLADLSSDNPILVGVRSAAEAEQALRSATKEREDLDSLLKPYIEAFTRDEGWLELLKNPDLHMRDAARRRMRDAKRI